MITLIVPCRNAVENLPRLVASVQDQTNQDWQMIIASDDDRDTQEVALALQTSEPRIIWAHNNALERFYALKNIYTSIKYHNIRGPIGIIDGDDRLCNSHTLDYVAKAFNNEAKIVYTAMEWDDRTENSSGPINLTISPYKHPWVTSHFRCFDADLFYQVPISNFMNAEGNWFKRGYDQALMLPMLWICKTQRYKVEYIPEICYTYCHKGSSTPPKEHSNGIIEGSIVHYIRQRGFVDGIGIDLSS